LTTTLGVEVDHRSGTQHLLLTILRASQVGADDCTDRGLVVLVIDDCLGQFTVSSEALPLVLGVAQSLVGVRAIDRFVHARLKVVRRAIVVKKRLLLAGGRHGACVNK
jgi:hypothetical protein